MSHCCLVWESLYQRFVSWYLNFEFGSKSYFWDTSSYSKRCSQHKSTINPPNSMIHKLYTLLQIECGNRSKKTLILWHRKLLTFQINCRVDNFLILLLFPDSLRIIGSMFSSRPDKYRLQLEWVMHAISYWHTVFS